MYVNWDEVSEEIAVETVRLNDIAEPFAKAKAAQERAKQEQGIGVYTAEEIAEQESEEDEEDEGVYHV